MNKNHEVCDSDEWRTAVRDFIIPWALGEGDLGDDVLEVGPGYGATTDVFRERVPHLTAVELDPELAARLAGRMEGTNVTVVEGDATALEFDADHFSGATCFSMLHHVPSEALQDRLFTEVARVSDRAASSSRPTACLLRIWPRSTKATPTCRSIRRASATGWSVRLRRGRRARQRVRLGRARRAVTHARP